MTTRSECPVCHRQIRVRQDGRFFVHTRDTTVYHGGRPIYDSAPCEGSGIVGGQS